MLKRIAVLTLTTALLGSTVLAQQYTFGNRKKSQDYHTSYAADPFTCGALFAGFTYYNTTSNVYLTCNGSAWVAAASSSGVPDAAGAVWFTANSIVFEGATANAFETTVTVTDPTADRTVTFADLSGTVALIDAAATWTANQTITTSHIFSAGSNYTLSFGGTDATTNGMWLSSHTTPASLILALGSTSNSVHIIERGDWNYDFNNGACGTSTCGNPQLAIHSANQATDQWLSFLHNGTNAIINSGLGAVQIISEGTADDYETTLTFTDPTADRTITWPDWDIKLAAAGGAGQLVLGSGAGAGITADDLYNTCLGTGSCAAMGVAVEALHNSCYGNAACDTISSGDYNSLFGSATDAGANMSYTTGVGYDVSITASQGTSVGAQSKTADGASFGTNAGTGLTANDLNNSLFGNSAGSAMGVANEAIDNSCFGDAACDTIVAGDANSIYGSDADVWAASTYSAVAVGETAIAHSKSVTVGRGSTSEEESITLGWNLSSKNSHSLLEGVSGGETRFVQAAPKTLTEGSATSIVQLSVADHSYTSAQISWVVVAADASDTQSLAGVAMVWAVNESDTEDCNFEELTAATAEATASGTLTVVPTFIAGTNACLFQLDATSSLTQTTLAAYYTVQVNGPATTITPQ